MDKRLIDADKLLNWLDNLEGNTYIHDISNAIKLGRFDPDPIPLPTIKPDRADSTRQLMHNTIEVMTDKQVRTLARTIGLEVSHE